MKKYNKIIFILTAVFIIAGLYAAISYSQDSILENSFYDEETGERIIRGLRFKMAEDRELEKHGSFYEPEGLDKYLGKKIDKFSSTMEELSKHILYLEDKISNLNENVEKISAKTTFLSEQIQTIREHLNIK